VSFFQFGAIVNKAAIINKAANRFLHEHHFSTYLGKYLGFDELHDHVQV